MFQAMFHEFVDFRDTYVLDVSTFSTACAETWIKVRLSAPFDRDECRSRNWTLARKDRVLQILKCSLRRCIVHERGFPKENSLSVCFPPSNKSSKIRVVV